MNYSLDEIEAIFTEASALPEEQWEAFIQEKCQGRPALLEEVRSLLMSSQKKGDVLELPATEHFLSSPDVAGEFSAGDTIGNYRLLQQIGSGGMGVVFMAQQLEPIKRKVALKIIKLGMDTKNVIARFESERQALAMMNHPSITRVLDAGSTSSGRPYFVMELVYGKSIKKYCNTKKLTIRQRIELFIQVCQAVNHAHQKGIIHRDIKPSNIMVTAQDGNPVPKVIDFGIAKATDHDLTEKTCFTSFGDMIGTVDYMSPEQAEVSSQDIDTRSDIYSLGVVLYELLTGTTPYKNLRKMGLPEIRRTIKSVEPERPSTRAMAIDETAEEACDFGKQMSPSERRSLKGELDWVILKCLEKDRKRRYDSAAELAKDLQRFLDGEPVEAAAPTVYYRLKKFAAKNKAYALTAAGCFLMLLVVSIVSVLLAYYSITEANNAKHASAVANEQLRHASQQMELAKEQQARAAADLERLRADRDKAIEDIRALSNAKRQLQQTVAYQQAVGNEIRREVEGMPDVIQVIEKTRIPKLFAQLKGVPLEDLRGEISPTVVIQIDDFPGGFQIPKVVQRGFSRTFSSSRSATGSVQSGNAIHFGTNIFAEQKEMEEIGLEFQKQLLRQNLRMFGEHGVEVANTRLQISKMYRHLGEKKKARDVLKKASKSLKSHKSMGDWFRDESLSHLKLSVQLGLIEMAIEDEDWDSAKKSLDLFDYSTNRFKSLRLPLQRLDVLKQKIKSLGDQDSK